MNAQNSKKSARRQSVGLGRWYRQRHTDKQYDARTGLSVVNFFPGRGLDRFENTIQQIGVGIMAVLWYRLQQISTRLLRQMPVRGFTAEAEGDGMVRYGGTRGVEFTLDMGSRPMPGGRGKVFDLYRHEHLLLKCLGMDKATGSELRAMDEFEIKLPTVPRLPFFYAVMPQMPEYQETPALVAEACARLHCSEAELRKMELGEQLLHTIFREAVIGPEHPENKTGGFLVRTDYFVGDLHNCAFVEDYRHLLGLHVWNPGRRIADAGRDALKSLGFRHQHLAAMEEGQVTEAVKKMRGVLGVHHVFFSDEEYVEALVDDRAPVKADGTTVQLAIGDTAYLGLLRSYMPDDQAKLPTDEDLLIAAADLNRPLVLSRVCRPQVIRLEPVPVEEANVWTPELLGRRIIAELETDTARPRPRKEKHGSSANAEPAVATQAGQQPVGSPDMAFVQ